MLGVIRASPWTPQSRLSRSYAAHACMRIANAYRVMFALDSGRIYLVCLVCCIPHILFVWLIISDVCVISDERCARVLARVFLLLLSMSRSEWNGACRVGT